MSFSRNFHALKHLQILELFTWLIVVQFSACHSHIQLWFFWRVYSPRMQRACVHKRWWCQTRASPSRVPAAANNNRRKKKIHFTVDDNNNNKLAEVWNAELCSNDTHRRSVPLSRSVSSQPDCGRSDWNCWKSPARWRAGLPALQHVWRTAQILSGGRRCWQRYFLPDFRNNIRLIQSGKLQFTWSISAAADVRFVL